MFVPSGKEVREYPNVKTNVERYVYHLTSKRNREGILREGLHNIKSNDQHIGPVFAHNTNRFETCWYWYCIDLFEFYMTSYWDDYTNHIIDNRSLLRFNINMFYDIWRIDTEKVNQDWFIDYYGLHDQPEQKENYYVKCFSRIAKEALTLCALDIDIQEQVEYKNGVKVTYYNPIIAQEDFIYKHGFEPEEEVLVTVNNNNYLDLSAENSGNEFYWKRLNKMKFSLGQLQEEYKLKKVA